MGSIPTRSRHPGPAVAGLLLGFLLLPGPGVTPTAAAQDPDTLPPADTVPAADTLQAADTLPAAVDTPRAGPGQATADTTPGPPISPLGAFGRSVLLPGWGQAEVDQPVRGAVYFAAEAASLWMVFKTQAKLDAARRGAAPVNGEDPPLVESRSGQREDWIVLSAFIALMSGVDAFVAAHLYGFEGELKPPEDGTAGVRLEYRVPLRVP